ncbi:MAG: hypothetical protein ABIA74_00405 [bacterium]
MKNFHLKNLLLYLIIFHFKNLTPYSPEKSELANNSKLNLQQIFIPTNFNLNYERITSEPTALLKAARDALNYFNSKTDKNITLTKPDKFEIQVLKSKDVKKTLEFIIETIQQDQKTKKFRILDPNFINKNFKFIHWTGNKNFLGHANKYIRLTQYAVFKARGSYEKQKDYAYPLYAIQNAFFSKNLKDKFSKQEILKGILEKTEFKDMVKPLVWLTRNDMEEALMQGSIIVQMSDGKTKTFNVDVSNNMKYNETFLGRLGRFNQKRFWYFKEVGNINGGEEHLKIIKRGDAVFAGNLHSIGLGKIIAIKYKNTETKNIEMRFGVLADKGAAFANNYNQLDYFVGVFDDMNQFKKHIKKLPNYVQAFIMVKK